MITPFSLRLKQPLSTAHGDITERRGFIFRIDRNGTVGVGEATPLPGWTERYDECETALTTYANTDATAPDPTTHPACAHAIESAELDAAARQNGCSLAAYLRKTVFGRLSGRDAIPLNATIGAETTEKTVNQAIAAVENGFRCLKLKMGVSNPEDDLDRARAVRDAVGETIAIRVDVNGGWDRETATDCLPTLAAIGIEYLEQPLPAGDIEGHTMLRERGAVPIAVDESLQRASVTELIAADAADILVLKPMVLGGPKQTARAAQTAQEHGLDVVVTTTIDAAVARTTAAHVAAAIPRCRPCGLATGSFLAEDVVTDPLTITDGALCLPDTTGIFDGFIQSI